MPEILYIMGVSGSGKSTIGKSLAHSLSYTFFDGDDFHPEKNVRKMSQGIPLTDEDRKGWLQALRNQAKKQNKGTVIACSALKEKYRKVLSDGIPEARFIHLQGSEEVIMNRLQNRLGHFMPSSLLESQFNTLEPLKKGIIVSIDQLPARIIADIKKQLRMKEFGLIGLGVMGKSLARNLAKKGFDLSLYNRRVAGVEESVADNFIKEHPELSKAAPYEDLSSFVDSLQSPRKVFLMVKAGAVTDSIIESLLQIMAPGDLIIDGGNAFFEDTERRIEKCKDQGVLFLGTGVSGGEKGALEGPSVMPGGSTAAYKIAAPYLEAIAAKDPALQPCCTYIGEGGAGHYVKMVHNGIEYAEMQLIAEVYALMRYGLGMDVEVIADIFEKWNQTELKSYLLEISFKILRHKEGDLYLIDLILDKAGNKGTGSWTTINMAALGLPATLISSALFARYISAFKEKRKRLASQFLLLDRSQTQLSTGKLKKAYQLARRVNHHQGFELIKTASDEYQWHINTAELARIWTNGCIIRSTLMEELSHAKDQSEDLLLQFDQQSIELQLGALRTVCTIGIQSGVSIPCLLSAVDFMNAHFVNYPTANIIQAQRDFFGAHTFQRTDDPEGNFHHIKWE